jgi:L-ascorbate metabolism protein UlaG (beta-lactamase superfamily)
MKARYWIAGATAAAGGALLWANRSDRGRRRRRTFYIELPPARETHPAGQGSVFFIGTATTLIRYQGFTILTDPNFLHRGEQVHLGYGMHSTRLTDPAIGFEDLPPVDFVVLSHLHEDHFDKLVERRLARETPIFTTASAARTLRRRGFTRTYSLRPWDTVEARKGDAGLKLTAMPGSHGPLLMNTMLPDVIGSMLEFHCPLDFSCYRIYISGDVLVNRDLHEIPQRFPHIDLALLHLGGTRVMGTLVTMNARQGIEALRIVKPEKAIPIHYNDYDVFREPLEEFVKAVERAGWKDKVRYLDHGETYEFSTRPSRATQDATLLGAPPLV